jgi:hypothetical protein
MRQIQNGTLAAEHNGRQWVVMLASGARSTASEPEQNQPASASPAEQAFDPLAGGSLAEPIAPRQDRPQDMIEQAIERLGTQHSMKLRALSEQFRQPTKPIGIEWANTRNRTSSFEQQLETPQPGLSKADFEQEEATAVPSTDSAHLISSVEPAEPTRDQPAEPTATAEQDWEALFKSKHHPPARPDSLPMPQAGRLIPPHQALTTLPTGNPGWRERIDEWWQNIISRYAYRSRLIFSIIGVILLLGALLGSAILLLLYTPSRDQANGVFLAATVPPPTRVATNAAGTQAAESTTPAALNTARSIGTPAAPTAVASGRAAASPKLATNAPSATPTSHSDSAMDMLRRVAAAEAALRRGQIIATISNADGTGAWAQLRFDFGDATNPPALHMTSSYTGTASAQSVERITIGDQSWERSPDGRWSARPAQEGVTDQVYVFLPHADSIVNTDLDQNADAAALHWYETGRDADVTLVVDPTSGTPRELRQVARATGTVRVVTYSLWNTVVDITPPKDN